MVTMFNWYLVNSDFSVNATLHTYTRQITFYSATEKHGHVELVTLYLPVGLCAPLPPSLPQLPDPVSATAKPKLIKYINKKNSVP